MIQELSSAGGRCYEKTKPWNSIFPDACFESLFLTFSNFPRRLFWIALNFFNVSQYLSEFIVEPCSRKSASTPSLSHKRSPWSFLLTKFANISLVFWENLCVPTPQTVFWSHKSHVLPKSRPERLSNRSPKMAAKKNHRNSNISVVFWAYGGGRGGIFLWFLAGRGKTVMLEGERVV